MEKRRTPVSKERAGENGTAKKQRICPGRNTHAHADHANGGSCAEGGSGRLEIPQFKERETSRMTSGRSSFAAWQMDVGMVPQARQRAVITPIREKHDQDIFAVRDTGVEHRNNLLRISFFWRHSLKRG